MKRDEFKVDVSPEMEIYNILQVLGYSIDTALAEFIDNSVQAFLENKGKLKKRAEIKIYVSEVNKTIEIYDNAGGITRETMQYALTPAGITLAGGAHPTESLSVYGVGMKTASIWFTNHWSLETSPIGKDEKFLFDFNLPELLKKGEKTGTVVVEDANVDETYTKITLHNIIRSFSREDFENKIAPFILETFQKFLKDINILFFYEYQPIEANPKFLELSEPKALTYMPVDKDGVHEHKCLIKWRLDIKVNFKGIPVTGFFLIRDTGSYEQAGIRLLRNNRIIEGTSVYPNIPPAILKTKNKYSAQRLYGEFHLDGFKVDFMKTRFSDDLSELYKILSDKIKNDFNVNLIFQADFFRARQQEKELLEKLTAANIYAKIGLSGEKLVYNGLPEETPNNNQGDNNTEDNEQNEFDLSTGTDSEQNLGGNNTSDDSLDISSNQNTANENISSEAISDEEVDDTNEEKDDFDFDSSLKETGQTKIEFSKEIGRLLVEYDSMKLKSLYRSLTKVSLEKHPAMAMVTAWSFFETIKSNFDNGDSFNSFFANKIKTLWFPSLSRDAQKNYKEPLDEINAKGNSTKHAAENFSMDAKPLRLYFRILEPVISKALQELIDNKA